MPRKWIADGMGGGHWQYLDFDTEWHSPEADRGCGVTEDDLPSVFQRLDEIQEMLTGKKQNG